MVSTLEVPIPAKENVRDGWQEQGKKAIESYKTILVGGALKYVNGNWGALLKGVVMVSDTVRLYPVFRLPLGENWYKGKCLLQEDSVHAMQPHAGQGVSMALEDVFVLSHLPQSTQTSSNQKSVAETFNKFEQLRNLRVEMIHKTTARSGERRDA